MDLLTSTTTSPAEYGGTGVGHADKYGCSINGKYLSEGSKVPPTPNKPCEHCYCIRNMTTCVMQECTLHVDGCTPIYHKDVCCPVRYSCGTYARITTQYKQNSFYFFNIKIVYSTFQIILKMKCHFWMTYQQQYDLLLDFC